MESQVFAALSAETLPDRLSGNAALKEKIGADFSRWTVKEVGDGNLNLVFIVTGDTGAAIVKQALPYVRLVGESWPLPLKRSFFEYHALTRQAARDPGMVPEILFFDEAQALIVMEYLAPHVILRRALIDGRQLPKIGRDLGLFAARTLFRGSDLSMPTREKKADLALFSDNVELCDITENLVFSDPYFEAALNRHTTPQLDPIVAELRTDRDLKVEAQRLKHLFSAKAETLCHGDLHTGSVMVTDDETRVIDPEFAFYGPISFDVGMLIANFWMSYFSQAGHETAPGARDDVRAYLLDTIETLWETFRAEFAHLWRTERRGILYQASLFEDRGDPLAAEQALNIVIDEIWCEMLGFAGVEIHRRILGLAHNADFETIADPDRRAPCETKALKLGRHLAVNRQRIHSLRDIRETVERLEKEILA
ncbi:S-methyl-5-thioribose kinase [Shinella sp. 838]|jgi:5-methylthioribose kinase|uniref:S-methyl-5-thioribose kinase n=1 Tax=unclassified Shinella TaxID=2643062 RepID=UPI0003C54699|nr:MULTISPECIES: S-methyl-5-thioribose kinase [unclassified Shinella]EYR81687.1 methylthioribose kinase MtnK [Shinella sp. DD12]MCA0343102.1 S-methyl-5-thioribose kinase [Pseudomonadota bacterium]MDG4675570.1 S-methyl-5-thioribose kinase [Shinella sp. 838]